MPIASAADRPTTRLASVLVGKTKRGKDIYVKVRDNARMFEIRVAGGGVQPPEFDGCFTSFPFAKQVVERYLAENDIDADADEFPQRDPDNEAHKQDRAERE